LKLLAKRANGAERLSKNFFDTPFELSLPRRSERSDAGPATRPRVIVTAAGTKEQPFARVHYERAGSGPPLLLLHGIGSNSRSFRHQLSELCDAFDVIAWDAPGYGRSGDPPLDSGLDYFADQAVALLDELKIESAHVLGVSLGGVIAQLVYHRHPSRVSSLLLVDTTPGGGAIPEPERSERVRQRLDALERLGAQKIAEQRAPHLVSRLAPPSLVAELSDIMSEVRSAGYRTAAIALGATDLTSQLSAINVPTLVIHGEQDKVVPEATAHSLATAIPNARLLVLRNAGHVSNQEQPEAFNAAVRSFLADL
jgi:3-oxoadipate enol-lactonase